MNIAELSSFLCENTLHGFPPPGTVYSNRLTQNCNHIEGGTAFGMSATQGWAGDSIGLLSSPGLSSH